MDEPAEVTFAFPLWLPVNRDNPESVIGGVEGDRSYLVVFTDESRAERFFVERGGRETAEMATINTPEDFAGLLRLLQQAGLFGVVFDSKGKAGGVERVTDIPRLLERLKKGSHG